MRLLVVAVALAGLTVAASAQTTPPPAAPPPAPPPAAATTPAASTPPVDCRAQAQSKGLRGQNARDAMQICIEEQRLACTKEAVEKKIVGPERRDFIRSCVGRPGGEGGRTRGRG